MNIEASVQNHLDSASVYTDFNQFAELRQAAKQHDPDALEKVAQQFESMFVSMMLKSMRKANEAFGEDNLLSSHEQKLYQGMFDQQIALDLGQQQGIGLAAVIKQQLQQLQPVTPTTAEFTALDTKIDHVKPPALPTFNSPVEFVQTLWPYAVAAAKKLNAHPKFLMAQAALETNWGKSVIKGVDGKSSHNLFNIKTGQSWKGDKVQVNTLEYTKGVAEKQKADFRRYSDYRASFDDYINLLKSPRYSKVLEQGTDVNAFARELQDAGYATDPKYAEKISDIFHGATLKDALRNMTK